MADKNKNQESAPAAVVKDAATLEVFSETVQEVPRNGASHQQFQQVPQQGQPVAQIPAGARVIHVQDLDPAALLLYAEVVEETSPSLAAAMRSRKFDATLTGGFKRVWSRKVSVSDVLMATGGALAIFLVWEGLAYKLDLPRVGLFDPTNPLKAIKK